MNLKKLFGAGVVAGALAFSSVAGAAVVVDTDTGYGFVGKGDVQYTFGGQNNAWLQTNAGSIAFRFNSTEVTQQETTWTCDRDAGPQTQGRHNVTTTTNTITAVADTIARDKKQITGFNLNGYTDVSGGTPVVANDGPDVGTCATGWTAINFVYGAVETVSSTGGLEVSADNGGTWRALLEAPVAVVL